MNSQNFYWLDLLRGIAAFFVFSGHLRSLLFLEYTSKITHPFGKIFYFLTGFGHQSVIIFFVLSGFFIAKSVDAATKRERWSFNNYLVDRFTRLWVVLLPALIITFISDYFGTLYFTDSPTYLGQLNSLPDLNPTGKSTFVIFLGNLFFLQEILVPTFGSNGPLWSLSYEFWYYILFPLLILSLTRKTEIRKRISYFILSIVIVIFIGKSIALYFVIWIAGAVTYHLYKRYKNPKSVYLVLFPAGIGFLCVMAFTRAALYSFLFNDFSLGIVTALFIYALALSEMKNNQLQAVSVFLSKISYTLYAVHLPLAVFLSAWLFHERLEFSLTSIVFYALLLITLLIIIYLIWFLFERNTNSIRPKVKLLLKIN